MTELPAEIVVDDLSAYVSDWWALSLAKRRRGEELALPKMAVKPRTNEEVAAAIVWANENHLDVIARGGGSGVCGSSQPNEASLIVDMTAMDRIIHLDEASMICHTQCGIGGPALEEGLSAGGMTLGHVPQSFHLSTLGGWIGTKATGQLSTKYGGIEDRLVGLEAVLSDGMVVSSRPSPRTSTGPEWWRLFIGAEGTLGVVTSAWLSAFPIPDHQRWIGFEVVAFDAGLEILRLLIQRGLRPSIARLYDQADAAVSFGSIGLGSSPVAILRFEGNVPMVEAEIEEATRVISGRAALLGAEAGEHWWERRFRAVELYSDIHSRSGALGPFGIVDTMEVAAFWSNLPRLYDEVRGALSGFADGVLAHASHLYQSGANVYFTFLISSAADDAEARSEERR